MKMCLNCKVIKAIKDDDYCEDCIMDIERVEKFECGDCGCYFWVTDRDKFDCPNCKELDRVRE